MNSSTLRLFNAVQINNPNKHVSLSSDIIKLTVRNGYVLDPRIQPTTDLLNMVNRVIGLSGEKANAAFHKSWDVIRDASMEQLVLQQIVHYITTYGFERLGIYNQETVYIPAEVLELPAIREDIPLVVVKAMTKDEVYEAVVGLASSGVALSAETLDDLLTVIRDNQFDIELLEQVRNRELRSMLYDYYGVVPSDPEEYLRFVVAKLTGESLLIKNKYLLGKIAAADKYVLNAYLEQAPEDLASIFFRYKPIFLALKSLSSEKNFFNYLRKQADRMHKALPEDYLNSITAQIKTGGPDLAVLEDRLSKASIFRKIRLAYALKFRETPTGDSIVYRIRNGRGWATDFDWPESTQEKVQQTLECVLKSIATDLRVKVEGKVIYIPSNVSYALPATEKQFTGNLPTGSYVSVPRNMVVGIHWTNTDRRVDLDLSVIGESGKIGWDAAYRTEDRAVLFSGDVTDAPAPKGAAELFHLREGQNEARILTVNYFNFIEGDEVRARILVARDKPDNIGYRNYMVDISKIVAQAEINITKKQTMLGLIVNVDGDNRVYFASMGVGNAISARQDEKSRATRRYMVRSLTHTIDFQEVLRMAGATVVVVKPDKEFIDLSPQALDKTTILNLLK